MNTSNASFLSSLDCSESKTSLLCIAKNKMENPFINNYDFRHIMNKLNTNRQIKNSIINKPQTIIKKLKNTISPLSLNTNNNFGNKSNNNSFMTLRKKKLSLSKNEKRNNVVSLRDYSIYLIFQFLN